MSVKKAEDSDEIVVRFRELSGQPASGVRLTSGLPLAAAREIDGQEMPVGPASLQDGALGFDLSPCQLRAFALKAGPLPRAPLAAVSSQPLKLPYDLDAVSSAKNPADGGFDGQGRTYPAEQFPASVVSEGGSFQLGSPADGQKNSLVCRGQSLGLPAGSHNRVYLLVSAVDADQRAEVKIDGVAAPLVVPDWSGFIGQWDERLWKGDVPELTYDWHNALAGLVPGYIKRSPVAWYCSHRHDPKQGNEFYQYAYLFKCGADLPPGAKTITLPDNDKIRVFAVSVASEPGAGFAPAAPLYDTFTDQAEGGPLAASPAPGRFKDAVKVTLRPPLYYREGNIRYTTDGSVPTRHSPVYTDGLALSGDTDLHACGFDAEGRPGPVWAGHYQVDDLSPPELVSVSSVPLAPTVEVSFSKPVQPASGRDAGRYHLSAGPADAAPGGAGVPIKSVQLSDGGTRATLHLEAPLPQTVPLKLGVRELVDASARANVLEFAERPVDGLLPVHDLPSLRSPREARSEETAGLPTRPEEPWTLNFFLRCDAVPEPYTLLGGFGEADDHHAAPGAGRYFVNFEDGIGFWLAQADLNTHVKIDPKRWQMLTASFDGKAVTLYKDGAQIAAGQQTLAPDAAKVGLGIADPWGRGVKFAGEIRDFKIWRSPVTREWMQALRQSGPAN